MQRHIWRRYGWFFRGRRFWYDKHHQNWLSLSLLPKKLGFSLQCTLWMNVFSVSFISFFSSKVPSVDVTFLFCFLHLIPFINVASIMFAKECCSFFVIWNYFGWCRVYKVLGWSWLGGEFLRSFVFAVRTFIYLF